MVKVREVMGKDIATIETSATVLEAVELLNQKGYSGLLATDKGKPSGVISDRRLLRSFIPLDRPASQVRVKEVMYKPLLRVDADADIKKAARILTDNRLTRIAVTENDKLVGVLTLTDIAKVASKKSLREMITEKWERKEELICPQCHEATLIQIQETYGSIWRCPECNHVVD